MSQVFPTPVGVFLPHTDIVGSMRSLPHARGGVSTVHPDIDGQPPSSPRPWGCFPRGLPVSNKPHVFPTPVGVFLKVVAVREEPLRLPHARGGVSSPLNIFAACILSSPRPWGCFCYLARLFHMATVFPTPVGVFPGLEYLADVQDSLPHARGGVSVLICAVSL